MQTREYAGTPFSEPRSHPWRDSADRPECRYYDLTASPAHIRESLEDFKPWSRYPAVEAFYALLERLNHVGSALESNDCAFSGPGPNDDVAVHKSLQCSGRLMLLFRALERNTVRAEVDGLTEELHGELSQADPSFRWGIIGTTIIRCATWRCRRAGTNSSAHS